MRADAASIIRPSSWAAPRPSRAASSSATRIRRARSTSAGGGVNTSLASAIWLGWIAHVPSMPSAAPRRAAALGIEGKWAIHPSQIALANQVFTPPPAEVDRARRILLALEEAAREGRGAAQLDGRMIDAASARMAQNVVETDQAIRKMSKAKGHEFGVKVGL